MRLAILFSGLFGTVLWSASSADSLFDTQPQFLPPAQAYQVIASEHQGQWTLELQITEGYYLYADKLSPYSVTYGITQPLNIEPGQRIAYPDPLFGEVAIFDKNQQIKFSDSIEAGELWVSLQGCSKQGLCYPPEKRLLTVVSN